MSPLLVIVLSTLCVVYAQQLTLEPSDRSRTIMTSEKNKIIPVTPLVLAHKLDQLRDFDRKGLVSVCRHFMLDELYDKDDVADDDEFVQLLFNRTSDTDLTLVEKLSDTRNYVGLLLRELENDLQHRHVGVCVLEPETDKFAAHNARCVNFYR